MSLVLGLLAGCKREESRPDTSPSAEDNAKSAGLDSVKLSPSGGDLGTLLTASASKAQARGLRPFVEVRADWCGPCRQLEASMNDPRMKDAFKGTYLITLDADDWTAAQLSGAGIDARSIPAFFPVDAQGKVGSRKITGGAWAENIPANMAPPLKAFFNGS